MEKELNIAAILKEKPEHTKLWSDTFGSVFLTECMEDSFYVKCRDDNLVWSYLPNGTFKKYMGIMSIFPSKSMRDWSKFAWKKGDVLYAESIDNYCIFNKFADDEYTTFEGKFLFDARNLDICNSNYFNENTDEYVKVSDDNAKIILSDLSSLLGGKLNLDTLRIEKTQFKDGDIVVLDDDGKSHFKTILLYQSNIDDKYEVYSFLNAGTLYLSLEATLMDDRKARPATDSEKQQLFDALAKENKAWDAEKKRIVDLPKKCEFKAFDKVLVRDTKDEYWRPAFFASLDEDSINEYCYCLIGDPDGVFCKYCIPYNDQTAHLLGTTDDWKGGEE